jgi:hypothetical protein
MDRVFTSSGLCVASPNRSGDATAHRACAPDDWHNSFAHRYKPAGDSPSSFSGSDLRASHFCTSTAEGRSSAGDRRTSVARRRTSVVGQRFSVGGWSVSAVRSRPSVVSSRRSARIRRTSVCCQRISVVCRRNSVCSPRISVGHRRKPCRRSPTLHFRFVVSGAQIPQTTKGNEENKGPAARRKSVPTGPWRFHSPAR